jgi:radical SAM superfamily enzyme YgiQ (UPF0313 family)
MKILFVYRYNYIEPIGLMYVSSMLRARGHETFFFDTKLSAHLEEYVETLKPQVIAYSIVTGTHHYYAELNRNLKRRRSFIAIFGGPHATFFPDFIEEEGVDVVCLGEGEEAMAEVIQRLAEGKPIKDVENFWVKEDEKIYRNPVRPLNTSLDSLPFPDRDLIYQYPAYRTRSNKYVLTSRGCPFDCTYCFNHSLKKLYHGKGVFCRKRSIESVAKEIEELKEKAPVKRIQFFDDVFILDKKWVLEFCKVYQERIRLPFICYVRVNLVDEDIIEALKYAGVVTITFAIETADDYLRNRVLKRRITDEQILRTVELLHQYKIRFFIQNMIGLPGETLDKAMNTLKLNARCKPSYAIASIFQPYPGTELTQYAIENGYYDGKEEIHYDSFYEKSILNLPKRYQFENLSWLFSLGVAFPRSISLIAFLIRLPASILYKGVWHLTRSYGYFFRIYWIDFWDAVKAALNRKVEGGVRLVEE